MDPCNYCRCSKKGIAACTKMACDATWESYRPEIYAENGKNHEPPNIKLHFFFHKHEVHKHTQPQIQEILSTLLSTPPASDFEIDNKIAAKLQFFPKISKKKIDFSPKISKR